VATVATIEDKLVKHLDEAYAMEQSGLRLLDSMIETTEDQEMRQELEQHMRETEKQAERLKRCLEAHDASPSAIREAGGIVGALLKDVVDLPRRDKTARNARDAYATEHMEIASYELLGRVATRAGDAETAQVAGVNLHEEEEMAQRISAHWDSVVDAVLRD
jgi:ferritin-like metal-binding protein YciE